jgi:hypothetical protein
MSIISAAKENKGMLLTSVFFIAAGMVSLAMLPLTLYPPHLAIIGIFSLITGYGLLTKRSWSLYSVVILFFMATTLALYTLYYVFDEDVIVNIAMIAYLILTWIATGYVAARRTKLEV